MMRPQPTMRWRKWKPLFRHHEQILSRFRADSELSLLNGRSAQWVPVSPLLWQTLTTAISLAELTDGLFDPTLLPALEAAGYTHTFPIAPGANGTSTAPMPGCWADIRLDAARQAVWLPAGVRLDFGGIGKGLAAQQAVQLLTGWGPCLIDAGGDLCAGEAPRNWPGWPVAVTTPTGVDGDCADLFSLWLVEASLSTSGIDYRRWQHNGRSAHHIIDPRTGCPADTDLLTVTVLLRSAAQAEGIATAMLVQGQEASTAWLEQRNIPAVLVNQAQTIYLTPAMAPAWQQKDIY
ncbi:MAG: FAD:protein FMN transferase [Ardenticatenaceae bacterium]|nr:FAD:protein FMN transferase [Ardenticatenaceae bacterium]